jgi:amino acid permease
VTASREGKWWYSTVHNVTAIVSAGVLGLPSAMADLTWGPGVVVLTLSWVITFFTLWQMVQMHEMVPGKRFDRYHELGQQAFGKKLGLWIVIPQQLLVEVSVDIVYMVTGGQALKNIYILNCNGDHHHCPLKPSSTEIKDNQYAMTSLWILIYGSVHFLFVQIPNFNSIAGISLAAAIMSVSYSTIAWTIPIFHNKHSQHRDIANYTLVDVTPDYHLPKASTAVHVLSAFNALGIVAFAYAGHNVVLEIQATLPSKPGRPSKIAMWRGVLLAYVIVTICYFPVALVCYWAYGNQLAANSNSNILQFESFRGITTAANFMVIIHILGSYQIYAMPVFDMLETVLVKKWFIAPSFKLRLITRSTYVGITLVVATIIPFFKPLLGFFGGFAYAPTTYFLPCCIWLAICQPKRFSASWTINWICIILGVLLTFTATIGGGWEIVKEWHTYRFKTFW